MAWAKRTAQLSHARRLQVGAIIVKDDSVISYGYNGMPAGWDNDCEDKVWDSGAGGWLDPDEFDAKYPYEEWHEKAERKVRYGLKTKPEVLQAEVTENNVEEKDLPKETKVETKKEVKSETKKESSEEKK